MSLNEPGETDAGRIGDARSPRGNGSVLRQMVRGSAWTVAARWSIRGIGLVSTIVLTRLLSPADFGLVAMGMVTVGFVQVFAEAGQDLAVIRHPNPTPEHFDTAWTMSVCGGIAVALGLVAIAPFAGWYFNDLRAVALTRFLALLPLIVGVTNVGVVVGYRKDLLFHLEFRYLVVRKLAAIVIAIPLAIMLRSYWALAVGIVGGGLATVVASYRMHPYRPRFRLTKLGEIWSFSAWSQLASVGSFFEEQTDQIAIGGFAGAAQMGRYHVASDVATSPTNELLVPAARALFPVYATLLQNPAQLVRSYLDVLSLVAVIALSTGVGVAIVSRDMVMLVLGAKWSEVAPLVPWLAVTGGVFGVARSVNNIFVVTGNVRLNAMRTWAFVVLLALAVTVAGASWGAEGVAAARAVVTILFIPALFYPLLGIIPVTTGQIVERVWRPSLAALSMAVVVNLTSSDAITVLPLRLLCNIAEGVTTFTVTLLTLWLLAGSPAGAERILIDQAYETARSLKRRIKGTCPIRGAAAKPRHE